MRRKITVLLLTGLVAVPLVMSHGIPQGFAQTTGPQSDEFNASGFTAPFVVRCGQFAVQPTCPDQQGANTYSLNSVVPGSLRIMTQFGSLVGSSNNARNFVVQPVNPTADYTITTRMTFPGGTAAVTPLGQTAGLLIYQDDNNFIYLGRVLRSTGANFTALEFLQETNGVDLVSTSADAVNAPTIYLRITKTGSQYAAFYSTDNVNFVALAPGVATPSPTATTAPTLIPSPTATTAPTLVPSPTATVAPTFTSTPTSTVISTIVPTLTRTIVPTVYTANVAAPRKGGRWVPLQQVAPTAYTASFTAPQVGVFAWGGTDTAVAASPVPADFDWFRSGDSTIPGPIATATTTTTPGTAATAAVTATSTATGTAVATVTPTVTSTAPPTLTAVATNTATPLPTATTAATATNTPIPTPTPRPVKRTPSTAFQYASIWYHTIRIGTVEHLQVQAKKTSAHGIWVHVIFGSGFHLDYYENTDAHGFWQKEFVVPGASIGRYSRDATVTFQLWKGKATTKTFDTFTVVH